jgi:hypothetical protein
MIFACLAVVAAIFYNLSGSEDVADGGGRCAGVGFFLLIVLLVETLLNGSRQKQKARGFDVIVSERLPPDERARNCRDSC